MGRLQHLDSDDVRHQLTMGCECTDMRHITVLTYFPSSETDERSMVFGSHFNPCVSFWERVKIAFWYVVRGSSEPLSESLVEDPECIQAFCNFADIIRKEERS